jgi:hypothetical protein
MNGIDMPVTDMLAIYQKVASSDLSCRHADWDWTLRFDHVKYPECALLVCWTPNTYSRYYKIHLTEFSVNKASGSTDKLPLDFVRIGKIGPPYGAVSMKTAHPTTHAGFPLGHQTGLKSIRVILDLHRFRIWNSSDLQTADEERHVYPFYAMISERMWGLHCALCRLRITS